MTITIIDVGSGNLHSVHKALAVVAEDMALPVMVTSQSADLRRASHIVLPGVGAFGDCMAGLMACDGMKNALEQAVLGRQIPFLGICVGMQMMLESGEEYGTHQGLGWIKGKVVALELPASYRIPHMGWNQLDIKSPPHPLLQGLGDDPHVYFTHSYHAQCQDKGDVLAISDYGAPITACIGRGCMIGTQFHPEKSGSIGLKLLHNFIEMT